MTARSTHPMTQKQFSGAGWLSLLLAAITLSLVVKVSTELLSLCAIIAVLWLCYRTLNTKYRVSKKNKESNRNFDQHLAPTMRREPASDKNQSNNIDLYWKTSIAPDAILGQWIYLGAELQSVRGNSIEPSLIDLALPIDQSVADCRVDRLGYWPSYSEASPSARAAYLYWLRTGRKDPEADLGYVFLYFYGLERRALYDVQYSASAKTELTDIKLEISRLISIYAKSNSFQNYAGSLLDLLKFKTPEPRQYEQVPPPLRRQRDLTFEHRLALAQCAADQAPLSAEWAFTWYMGSNQTQTLRTPAVRCPIEFENLFRLRYAEVFGQGMTLTKNNTLLKLEHRPASPSFPTILNWGTDSFSKTVHPPLPDVTVLSSPLKPLEAVADYCCSRLEAYSRFVRSHPHGTSTFDAILELPIELWPTDIRNHLAEERKHLAQSPNQQLSLTFKELRAWFPPWNDITKPKLKSFGQALSNAGLSMEPDIRFGGGIPNNDSVIVLFADVIGQSDPAPTPQYSAAALTLQLATAVSNADEVFSDIEKTIMTQQLENWRHLAESETLRLHAHLQHLMTEPPRLSDMKKRIEALDTTQKATVGDFLALVVLADAVATSSELTALEKIFKLLGLNAQSVYSKLHVAATEPITVRGTDTASTGYTIPSPPNATPRVSIQLDRYKIAALEADSVRVANLLRNVFGQQEPEVEAPKDVPQSDETPAVATELLGLNSAHTSLMRTILTRTSWTRSELEELASDRAIMLDGALEQMNDAAFNHFDAPLFEGQDPIEINRDIVGKLPQ